MDEIEPQINELLSRAEKGLQILIKKESVLQAKVRVVAGACESTVLNISIGRSIAISSHLTRDCKHYGDEQA